jgi:hypothetical protein
LRGGIGGVVIGVDRGYYGCGGRCCNRLCQYQFKFRGRGRCLGSAISQGVCDSKRGMPMALLRKTKRKRCRGKAKAIKDVNMWNYYSFNTQHHNT